MLYFGTCCYGIEASPVCGCTRPGTYSHVSGICILRSSRAGWTGTQAWTADWSNWSLEKKAYLSGVGYEGFPGTGVCPALSWSSLSPGTEEWWSCWVAVLLLQLTCCFLTTCGWDPVCEETHMSVLGETKLHHRTTVNNPETHIRK